MVVVVIGDDTVATKRHLPHLQRDGKWYFVTFTTRNHFVLSEGARDIALQICVNDHERTYFLECVVIMPDHVHMLFAPVGDWSTSNILQRIKGVSSHRINHLLGRRGPLWQDESFDRILRSGEDLSNKSDYICANPERAGFVNYRWTWRRWAT